ncbi:biofilm development regulator YmgB/AriR family protein [Pantoea sp. A4]|uniref:biofilm development regulator YmgB/AriR family protein n=1 Tax=Pantoea sp. A4 TaxID=1225184 RepID=UPI000375989A|nr:biofilm development regulator YmgB/AriR family protein [Pantoea sp. A4]
MQLKEQNITNEADIIQHGSFGDALAAEAAVLDAVIRDIVIHGKNVTTKEIILYLIAELESTSDVVELDVLRSTLEIVVGKTPDDVGF